MLKDTTQLILEEVRIKNFRGYSIETIIPISNFHPTAEAENANDLLELKKLTHVNPTMKAKFDELNKK